MLLFMFPFGVLICIWDRKSIADSMRLFNDYIIKMQHADFDNSHKMDRIDTMFYENGYKITRRVQLRSSQKKSISTSASSLF